MEEEEEEGRMSQLPDEMVKHIISFINIKQAVETSTLSRSWENLWLSLFDLNFNFKLNFHRAFLDWEAAKNFVDQFLSRRDGDQYTCTTRKFRLSFEGYNVYDDKRIATSHQSFVEKCADYAINHGVTDLHLDALCSNPVFMAPCKTLLELTLRRFYFTGLPNWFSLPHLKTLYLEDTSFGNLEGTFSGFPVLEKLTIKRCRMHRIHILFPKLRILEIICRGKGEGVMKEISTPELTSFRYEAHYPLLCSKANDFPMLEKACFDIKLNHGINKDEGLASQCMKLLHQFGNAKIVALSLDIINAIETDGGDYIKQNPSPFLNMKCLKLMKGNLEIQTVHRTVMNYLTNTEGLYGDSVMVKLPEGVSVVEDSDELPLEGLFQIQD